MLCKLCPLVTWCQGMSTADSHCQEADQIVQTRNFTFLQSEDKKGRLRSCVFSEMWKHNFAEARSCVSNEVNSSNLKCSVFSISVCRDLSLYPMKMLGCTFCSSVLSSAPLLPQSISRDRRRGFSPGCSGGCWTELMFHWTVMSSTRVLSVTEMSQGTDLRISINTREAGCWAPQNEVIFCSGYKQDMPWSQGNWGTLPTCL